MSPIRFNRSPKLPISKTLVSLLLVISLAACGNNVIATASTKPYSNNTANKLTHTFPSLTSNMGKTSIKTGDLLIQSNFGFQCPYASVGSNIVPNQLVLASDRTTYSQNEIAQMRGYLTRNASFKVQANPNVAPPPTLRWVLGGLTAQSPATTGMNCESDLNITNTGATTIQIPEIEVQLEARPQPNNYQYRLIDACSVIPQDPNALSTGCNPLAGGGGGCNVYFATIQLGFGQKKDVYSAVPAGTNDETMTDCGTLTLAPAADVQLAIMFSPAPNTQNNLIYSIMPIFTVITAQGVQKLSLSQLVSTLAFASADQFSCYGLQGTTFVLLHSPDIQQNWCM